jgi:hypothetical protein
MRADDVTRALDVGGKWTRQIKSEEKRPSSRTYRSTMWTASRTSLKEICYEHMVEAWNQASDGDRLPTHWRQVFYVMRPICDDHPDSDRPLRDTTFKQILESYLEDRAPGWDVLRGARGVFKEPHAAEDDNGLAMSTMNVRGYLNAACPSSKVAHISRRFPTKGAENRIAAVLICEKEGFDELLEAEDVPARYDLALMSTKGISAKAARDLAEGLGVPYFTLHDLDKNGFVMAGGFVFATDLGIRLDDVDEWDLRPEDQHHSNADATYRNLIHNGATPEEAEFISGGQRVELNMLSGPDFIRYVEQKLEEHGVEKVVPDDETLKAAWRRAHIAVIVNRFIDTIYHSPDGAEVVAEVSETDGLPTSTEGVPDMPDDLADQIRERFDDDPTQSWDQTIVDIITDPDDNESDTEGNHE